MTEITKALPADAEEIYAIYGQRKGSPGCTWDEHYPTLEFVRHDIEERNSLYKLTEDGKIIAAAYLGDFEEREVPECFDKSVKRRGEFSRVGVRREYHRKGYAERLLRFLLAEAPKLGYDGLILLVGTENLGAMALYEKLGFQRRGDGVMYGTHWYFYEYILKG
ncbi:MAG: GNAT family N-acetyltransferase [Lachnospiraceae bacterium]|nr:GNAT family N-acetyltransferase [Ruminococcus sp.]MCM1274599.1 GNAT family N-acetyltransferase [Lachnospiraceae bacterium]